MKTKVLIISSLITCLLLFLVEQYTAISYLWKTLLKISLFVGIPVLVIKKFGGEFGFAKTKHTRWSLLWGAGFAGVVVAAYFILAQFIDLSHIASEIASLNINKTNYLLVGAYIIFVNSFLEEFFFRGYLFLNLKDKVSPIVAYAFPSFLFSVYHMAIFATWFSPLVLGVSLFGLAAVGFFFNWLDAHENSLFPSWIAHILCDVAVIGIGWFMFI